MSAGWGAVVMIVTCAILAIVVVRWDDWKDGMDDGNEEGE